MKKPEMLINKVSNFEQEDPSSIIDKGTNFSLLTYFKIANGVTPACSSICTDCSLLEAKAAGARS
jgi:hypothetical protein